MFDLVDSAGMYPTQDRLKQLTKHTVTVVGLVDNLIDLPELRLDREGVQGRIRIAVLIASDLHQEEIPIEELQDGVGGFVFTTTGWVDSHDRPCVA